MLKAIKFLGTIFSFLIMFSCGDIKNLQYVQGSFDTARVSRIAFQEPVIQKRDLLSIKIYSDNQLASSLYNPPEYKSNDQSSTEPASNASANGYLVDEDGNIRLYGIGILHVDGMTRKHLADTVAEIYAQKQLLQNPYADVRFLNFKVTLIGDFNRPGVYTLPNEKVSIFDAIGLAGDLTPFARRDNVLVIREEDGKRTFGRLNLTQPDSVFNSDFYFLKQNDMVVVDITKAKKSNTDQATARNITIAASVLSTIAIFISVFKN